MARIERGVAGLGPSDAVIEAFATGADMVENDPLLRRVVFEDVEIRSITATVSSLFITMITDRVATTLRRAGRPCPTTTSAKPSNCTCDW